MFTGIVEEVGAVAEATGSGLVIAASTVMDDLAVADSICVNGACLTVTAIDGETFSVDTVPETFAPDQPRRPVRRIAGQPRTLDARQRTLRRPRRSGDTWTAPARSFRLPRRARPETSRSAQAQASCATWSKKGSSRWTEPASRL